MIASVKFASVSNNDVKVLFAIFLDASDDADATDPFVFVCVDLVRHPNRCFFSRVVASRAQKD